MLMELLGASVVGRAWQFSFFVMSNPVASATPLAASVMPRPRASFGLPHEPFAVRLDLR